LAGDVGDGNVLEGTMLGRLATAICVAFMIGVSADVAESQDVLVEDAVRADVAVAAALDGRFADAAKVVTELSRLDQRDAVNARVAVVAARRAGIDVAAETAQRFAGCIADVGIGRDTSAEIAIAMAWRGKLDIAESMTANLDPPLRDKVRAVIAMVMAEQRRFRDAWLTAKRTNDVGRRRESLETVTGGLGETLSVRAAIGAALGAETQASRVRSLIAVARDLVARGKRAGAFEVLSRIPRELRKGFADSKLTDEANADRAMILLSAGDMVGALQAADEIRLRTLRSFLTRNIEETRKYPGSF
jgi:hypothetical protein